MNTNHSSNLFKCPLCDDVAGVLWWKNDLFRIVEVNQADYPGYCQIIWQQHISELTDLTRIQQTFLFSGLVLVEETVRKMMHCDKVNLASLGNFVPHLHWHLIPRFRDDKHFPESIWGNTQRFVDPKILLKRVEQAKQLPAAIVQAFSNFNLK